ncbi:MAG: YceI family protein [Candidatus Rokubacteria bacterium]|nr:YceI family protein [Candidatus Rokubacteria bacterium]
MKRSIVCSLVGLGLALPAFAAAEPISFKLLPRYSYATFKTDAPLETVVGHTADAGVQGGLTVDPAKPQAASGTVKIDMNVVRTGIDKRDADMRTKPYLETEVEANRWVTFEVKSVEIAGPLQPGATVPAKVHGILTVKQKPLTRVADATVTYIKLTPEQAEAQKRFGFTTDNIKVRAKLATTFTDHGMQVPQLLILKLANDIRIETDLTFVRQ